MQSIFQWFVYMVRCKDGTLYTGITIDLAKRISTHNAGKGAKYTRSRLPVVLAWSAAMESESDARKAEVDVKQMTKKEKEEFITQ